MRRRRLLHSGFVLSLLFCPLAWGVTPNCNADPSTPKRAFPSVEVNCKFEIRYAGMYLPDAKYRASSMLDDLSTARVEGVRSPEVPKQWSLHPREKVVHNFLPTVHGKAQAPRHSVFTQWRDDLITLVYGRERAFVQPRFIVTDAQGRVLVGDPAAGVVHVLDGERSFRISADPQDRLRSIAGVAADGGGNIYVGDPEAERIVVFDPQGRWLREMGRFSEEEGLFHEIAGMAIDRDLGRLYVADASRDAVLILDLEGKVVARIGGRRHELGIEFERPTAIAAKYGIVLVADMDGTRIRVFDPEGKLQRTFFTYVPRMRDREISLDVDQEQNVYVADLRDNCVRVFAADGRMLASLGTPGEARGQFTGPSAVWIDENHRLYVGEAVNRRVQVFEIAADQTAVHGAAISAGGSR